MNKIVGIFIITCFSVQTTVCSQCPTPIIGDFTINTPCTGDIVVTGNSGGTPDLLTINAAVTGNITFSNQRKELVISSTGSVSGSVIVNDQQISLFINGPIGTDLDINAQQVNVELASNIDGSFDLGDQQVDVDIVGDAIVGSIVTSGQQNDFIVDNGDNSTVITLTILNDVCVEDQQNSIQTAVDDIVNIRGTVKCTGTGCNQFDFVGNVNASACTATSGTFCSDADLNIDPSLPIELLYFSLREVEDVIEINWSTVTEENNDYFTIQKSYDGVSFFDLMELPGAGDSNENIKYQYQDKQPIRGLSYYRLRQTDFDGTNTTFRALAIEFLNGGDFVKIYPNPVTDKKLTISSRLNDLGNTFVIYDFTGRVVFAGDLNSGENEYDLGANLKQGIYFIKVLSALDIEIATQRIVVK